MKIFRTVFPLRRALLLPAAILLLLPAFAHATAPTPFRVVAARSLIRGFAGDALAADELRPAERTFLNKAQEESRQQMRLAEIGVSQAQSTEVRSQAQQLAADYRSLNDALEALTRRKGGIAGAPVGATSETYQKLATTTGASFDREFVRTVSDLTDKVMTLFEQAAADAKDADVRELAAAQLPVLRAQRNAIAELKKTFE